MIGFVARAFVAVVPPAPLFDAVATTAMAARANLEGRPGLGGSGRWVPPAQWHLTLAFLGNDVDLEVVAAQLATVEFGAFMASLRGIGAFPRPRSARVLWLGVCDGRRELIDLAADLDRRLGARADQPFRPHLTLARFRAPVDARSVVTRDRDVGTWRVDELVLFESVLGSRGARHRPHARFALR